MRFAPRSRCATAVAGRLTAESEATAGAGVDARRLELARLDALQSTFWSLAAGGYPKAAKVVLRVVAQRSKMLVIGGSTSPDCKQVSPITRARGAGPMTAAGTNTMNTRSGANSLIVNVNGVPASQGSKSDKGHRDVPGSPRRSVKTHVGHILAKLGPRDRV